MPNYSEVLRARDEEIYQALVAFEQKHESDGVVFLSSDSWSPPPIDSDYWRAFVNILRVMNAGPISMRISWIAERMEKACRDLRQEVGVVDGAEISRDVFPHAGAVMQVLSDISEYRRCMSNSDYKKWAFDDPIVLRELRRHQLRLEAMQPSPV